MQVGRRREVKVAQPHILANGPPCGPVALFLGSSSGQTRPRGTAPERFSCIFTNESAVWVRAKYRASADRRTDLRLDVAPFLAASRRRTWTRVVHATSFFLRSSSCQAVSRLETIIPHASVTNGGVAGEAQWLQALATFPSCQPRILHTLAYRTEMSRY